MVSPLEILWRDSMTVSVRAAYRRANGSESFRKKVIIRDAPCKISYSDAVAYNQTAQPDEKANAVEQIVKVFCSPRYEIPAGSEIEISHNGRAIACRCSGQPAVFTDHQEIRVEVDDKWA